ncbi:unnamed protein product [Orchesella dallaii]|uniref:MYND-type domain-containing protein n=1 Tax=Orchesella dallaii TaxID=48710 RepID=A0ABP1PQ24_9HEXA
MEPDSISSSKSSIMSPMQLSDEEYFYKLDNMVSVSCEVLRNIFRSRWKKESGDDWKPTDKQGKDFIKGLGKFSYQKSDPIQKTKIATGCLEDWDLCLLSLVILNVGDRRSYKSENESVHRLLTLRNTLAHHPTRKVTKQDYQGKMNVFRKSLKGLGVKDEDIEKMIANSGTSCSDAAFKMAKKLYDKAKCKMAKNNFEKAIERCNEAIELPSLLPTHLSIAYENRAECYLKFALNKRESQKRQESYKYIDQAVRDGNDALKLNINSWKAHYFIGRCYRLNNEFQLAIKHLTSAYAISPSQTLLKTELDSCRVDAESYNSVDCWHPSLMTMTLKERVAENNAATGYKKMQHTNMRDWNAKMRLLGTKFPGADDVIRGDQYRDGLRVKACNTEAAKYYSKAADLGNLEGMVKLGDCYLNGHGVPQDPAKSHKLFLKVANMSPNLPSSTITLANKNHGVASAQFSLGVLYANGLFVEKDNYMAANWYRKAAENGDPFAACNLARLYADGNGVAEDEKMAELYWYKAVAFGDSYAAVSLVQHYLSHLEPEKAEAMFTTAKSRGHIYYKCKSDEEFQTEIQKVVQQRNRRKAEVIEFEKEHNLDTKGLTVEERFWRKMRSKNSEPMLDKYERLINEMRNKFESDESWHKIEDELENDLNRNIKLVGARAKEGSALAAEILNTRNTSHNLIHLIGEKETFSNKQKLQVLNLIYECVIGQFNIVSWEEEIDTKLKQIINELYESKRGRHDQEEMKIRLVYVELNYPTGTSSGNFASKLLKQGIEMYPDNVHYYTSFCAHEKDLQSQLRYVEIALKRWPHNVNLYYKKATILQRNLLSTCRSSCKNCRCEYAQVYAPRKKKEVVEAYEKFIRKAPKDDRNLPNAYYSIAMIHVIISTDFKMMNYYYKLGKQAEENQLPCFLSDYQNEMCIEKTFVENVRSERGSPQAVDVPDAILERRKHLKCPVRRWMITRHRTSVNDLNKKKSIKCSSFDPVRKPKEIPPVPDRMYMVKPITIKQMALSENRIYENRVLELTIIDVPKGKCCLGLGVHLIAEDEDGDVTHLNIYGMWKSEDSSLEKLGMGARIAILHPHMQTGSDPILIVNDDPDSIIFLEKVENMCWFCAESVATKDVQRCGRCRKAVYCSKECQEHDWKIMKHKLICSNI